MTLEIPSTSLDLDDVDMREDWALSPWDPSPQIVLNTSRLHSSSSLDLVMSRETLLCCCDTAVGCWLMAILVTSLVNGFRSSLWLVSDVLSSLLCSSPLLIQEMSVWVPTVILISSLSSSLKSSWRGSSFWNSWISSQTMVGFLTGRDLLILRGVLLMRFISGRFVRWLPFDPGSITLWTWGAFFLNFTLGKERGLSKTISLFRVVVVFCRLHFFDLNILRSLEVMLCSFESITFSWLSSCLILSQPRQFGSKVTFCWLILILVTPCLSLVSVNGKSY